MASELIINVNPQETRAALIENGLVTEIYVERDPHRGYVGNIYKGRVLRVLPGMQAAFVDIGLERSAFLFVSDIDRDSWRTFSLFLAGEEEPDSYQAEQVDQALRGEAGYDYSLQPRIPPHGVPIEEIARIFGHRDTKTTLHYLGLDRDDMNKAMRKVADYRNTLVCPKTGIFDTVPVKESGGTGI